MNISLLPDDIFKEKLKHHIQNNDNDIQHMKMKFPTILKSNGNSLKIKSGSLQ